MGEKWLAMLPRPGPKRFRQALLRGQSIWILLLIIASGALAACGKQGTEAVQAPEESSEAPVAVETLYGGQQSQGGTEEAAQPPETAVTETPAAEEFADIIGHSSEEYILEGLRLGFYEIPSDGLFRPDDEATVEEFAVAVWNLAGRPGAADGSLSREDEIQSAVSWITESAFVELSDFTLDAPLTRMLAMELLFRLNGSSMGLEILLTGVYDEGFVDSDEIPEGGKAPLYWGFYNVLIREPEPDIIAPFGTVTRGDMAEILVRFTNTFRSEPPEN